MLTGRSRVDELGMLPKQFPELREISLHDGLHGAFKRRYHGTRLRQLLHMAGKLRPACKAMLARNGKLCLSQSALPMGRIGNLQMTSEAIKRALNTMLDFARRIGPVPLAWKRDVQVVKLYKRVDPLARPGAQSFAITGLAELDQLLRPLLILLEVRTRRQRKCIGHTNLLSCSAWLSASVRLKEGS